MLGPAWATARKGPCLHGQGRGSGALGLPQGEQWGECSGHTSPAPLLEPTSLGCVWILPFGPSRANGTGAPLVGTGMGCSLGPWDILGGAERSVVRPERSYCLPPVPSCCCWTGRWRPAVGWSCLPLPLMPVTGPALHPPGHLGDPPLGVKQEHLLWGQAPEGGWALPGAVTPSRTRAGGRFGLVNHECGHGSCPLLWPNGSTGLIIEQRTLSTWGPFTPRPHRRAWEEAWHRGGVGRGASARPLGMGHLCHFDPEARGLESPRARFPLSQQTNVLRIAAARERADRSSNRGWHGGVMPARP